MTPTTEQIEFMAKLVPEHVDNVWSRQKGAPMVAGDNWRGAYVMRDWRPWEQTEAGRSDALVLLAAVCKWSHDNWFVGVGVSAEVETKWRAVYAALTSGDMAAIQQATCEAAETIGRGMP